MTQVLRTAAELRALPRESLGFVPTMGALHEGHAALLRRSVQENPRTLLSVFVNPTQFGPAEDFSRYPRTFEADLALAEREKVDYLFAPLPEEIYPPGWRTFIEVEKLQEVLCGKYRPGHFRGVATVVHRLFQLVRPHKAYFGQKDLQQCVVLEKMVADLGLPVSIEICPTVREQDGLALSSRNRYLTAEEREQAPVIYRALLAAQEEKEVSLLLARARAMLAQVPAFELQYLEVRSLPNLEEISRVEGRAAIFVAGYFGKTRLIDNRIFKSA